MQDKLIVGASWYGSVTVSLFKMRDWEGRVGYCCCVGYPNPQWVRGFNLGLTVKPVRMMFAVLELEWRCETGDDSVPCV